MHPFRFYTPYPAPARLLRCLASANCSPCFHPPTFTSSYVASQSRSHFSSFDHSAVKNPFEHRKPTPLKKSDGNSEKIVGSHRKSKLVQSSLLSSPSPDDVSRTTTKHPVRRLDISGETTYTFQRQTSDNNKNGRLLKGWGHHVGNSPHNKNIKASQGWGPHTRNNNGSVTRQNISGRQAEKGPARETYQSRIALLTGVGTTLLESDIRRLVPSKLHIPEFKSENDILRVSPYRLPRSLLRRPFYSLVFSSHKAARDFVFGQGDVWLSQETSSSTIPPGCKPRLYLPHNNGKLFSEDYGALLNVQSRGGCFPGACVLLVASGIGGNTPETGKLPRTTEIRQKLKESDVQLCKGDEDNGGIGVERIFFDKDLPDGTRIHNKFNGSGTGAEGKWIIRCRDAAEAHRVVREWNRKELGEGLGKFKAEILY